MTNPSNLSAGVTNDINPAEYMYTGRSTDKIKSGGTGDPILDAFLIKQDTSNTRGSQLETQQQFIEYLTGEQNYLRSLEDREYHSEGNQLARLMASGMSRSAALQALTGATSAQSQSGITPIADHSSSDITNAISATLQGVTQFAQMASQLYTLPFDIEAKRLTNRALSSQTYLLENQRIGLDSAAEFAEAVSNANAMGANLGESSLQEQYDYFVNQASLQPGSDGYNAPAAAYGEKLQRSGVLSNPYFWSAISNIRSGVSNADASVYEPEHLRAIVQRQYAAAALARAQSKIYPIQARLLSSDAFVAEMTQDLQIRLAAAETTIGEASANAAGAVSAATVAEANYNAAYFKDMLGILPTITAATLEEYSYRLAYLETLHDPALFESERKSFIASNEYDAVVYTKLKMIEDFKSRELADMTSGADPDKLAQYQEMVREGIALIDLYGSDIHNDQHLWIRDIATGLGLAIGGYAAFGGRGRSGRAPSPSGYRGNRYNNGSIYNYTSPM